MVGAEVHKYDSADDEPAQIVVSLFHMLMRLSEYPTAPPPPNPTAPPTLAFCLFFFCLFFPGELLSAL